MEIRSFFQKVSHARNETEAHKNRIYVLMPILAPRSPFLEKMLLLSKQVWARSTFHVPLSTKKWHCGHFSGAKMLKMRKKLKKTIIFCQ